MSEINEEHFWREHRNLIGISTVLGLGALAFGVAARRNHLHQDPDYEPQYDIPPDDEVSDNS